MGTGPVEKKKSDVLAQAASSPRRVGWAYAALVLLLALFYMWFVVGAITTRGLFDYAGMDFLAFRCSAEIAYHDGFPAVYDLARQEQCQRPLYETYVHGPWRANYATIPTPYLPAFVLPFFALLLLPPVPGLAAWTALNLAVLVFYLWRFARAANLPRSFLLPVLVCFPVFANWFFGQVNVWLLICLGEFLLASVQGKAFRGGLWLAGLLLKPHTLLLLLPGLLLSRRFKALAGFAMAGLGLLLLSLLLAGWPGLLDLARLLLLYPGDLATTNPQVMMNWRVLAVHLALWVPSPLPTVLAVGGAVLTAVLALWLWLRPADRSPRALAIAVLGTTAATCAVAWHAHAHMALVLVAPLLFLTAKGWLPRAVLNVWLFGPALLFAVAIPIWPGIAHNLVGIALLALNLYLVIWSFRARRQPLAAAATG